MDDAWSRVGFGWKARKNGKGARADILGVRECTEYLNDLVRAVLDDFCGSLRAFDRRSLVKRLLLNHEAASCERDTWTRTARSNLALHDDKEAALQTIVEHIARLNACFVASRIVLEAAICECPVDGGVAAGELDLSRAMALAMRAHYLGGWSDGIRWGAIEPRVRITPLGDVHIHHRFMDSVYEPFGRIVGGELIKDAADSYPEIYQSPKVVLTTTGVLEQKFLTAWEAEFGIAFDGLRAFLDAVDDLGDPPREPVLELPRPSLIAKFASAARVSDERAAATLDYLTLTTRPQWRVVGGGFTNKDWYPWRFRRALSVLRRPFIAIEDRVDSPIMFAPGLVREAVFAVARSFHEGGIPNSQVRSKEMGRWIGYANVKRTNFNRTVADRMRELGWTAESEVKLTNLLRRSLDRD